MQKHENELELVKGKRGNGMKIKVRAAEERDVERVAVLYEKLHDYLETHENHPRWKRDIYPTKVNAEEGFQKKELYVAEIDGKLAGSVIYLHEQGDVYNQVKWSKEIQDNHVYEKNDSAIRFYESCGFSRRGTIDLGLEELYGLKWYYAYEKPV